MLARLYRTLRLAWEALSSQFEARLFLTLWLCLAVVIILISILTGFYRNHDTLSGILTEAHGALIELLLVGIVASLLISRRARRDWRPTRDTVLARLLTEADRLLNTLLPDSLNLLHGQYFFFFGEAKALTKQHYLSLEESEVEFQVVSDAMKEMDHEELLIVGSSEEEVIKDRVARFLRLRQTVSESQRRLQPLFESAQTLVAHSIPPEVLSAVARLDYAILDLLDTLDVFQGSGFRDAWISVGGAQGRLAVASLCLLKVITPLSLQSVSMEEQIKSLMIGTEKS